MGKGRRVENFRRYQKECRGSSEVERGSEKARAIGSIPIPGTKGTIMYVACPACGNQIPAEANLAYKHFEQFHPEYLQWEEAPKDMSFARESVSDILKEAGEMSNKVKE